MDLAMEGRTERIVRIETLHGSVESRLPLLRFNQDTHPFIAVTSASVVGPDTRFEAPFLAIKRSHILAVQPIDREPPE